MIINTKIVAGKIVGIVIKIYSPVWFLSMFMLFGFIEVGYFFKELFKYLFLLPIIFGFLFLYGTFLSLFFSGVSGLKFGYFLIYLSYILFPIWYAIEQNLKIETILYLYVIPIILFDMLLRHCDFEY